MVRSVANPSVAAARAQAGGRMQGAGGLMIGGIHDPAEKAADRVADRVMRMPTPVGVIRRKCAECAAEEKKAQRQAADEEEETVRTKAATGTVAPGATPAPASASAQAAIGAMGVGRPLSRAERAFFEPRFGVDFSAVRVHDDAAASRTARALDARAFTLGHDIAFAPGERRPGTPASDRLLAHELAHLSAGLESAHVRRDTPLADEVCKGKDLGSIKAELDILGRQYGSSSADDSDVAKRELANKIVLGLKYLRRCISDEADKASVLDTLRALIGSVQLDDLWTQSASAFGGHVGYYPGYASDLERRLTELGISESSSHRTFETSASGSTHRARAKAASAAEVAEVSRADVLYFRGHQFAQYRAPGMFTDGKEERGVDLRYLQQSGGFPNVKLLISTSCATLCNEALDVFTGLFPNATMLGYGKSAPLEGSAVRTEFGSQIKKMNLPLILSESSDVARVVDAWKATVESRHKGAAAKYPRPGYYQGGNVHYWDGATWTTQAQGDADNNCYRKGDFRGQYPEPPAPAP